MPIGAYDPWIYKHCNPEQAVAMADAAGARLFVPVHHQTFRLSREPFDEPIGRVEAALAAERDRLAVREIGQCAWPDVGGPFANVATSGYIQDMETGIRKLKDNLSRYIRRIEAGERILVTAHGRVVAELVPPGRDGRTSPGSRWDELIAAGLLHPPVEAGDPFEGWPDIRLPGGTAAELIDSDRGEA